MEALVHQAAAYFSRFEEWPIWEKLLWVLPVLAVGRLIWWLFEVTTDESKSSARRIWSGAILLIFLIAAVVALAVVADALT